MGDKKSWYTAVEAVERLGSGIVSTKRKVKKRVMQMQWVLRKSGAPVCWVLREGECRHGGVNMVGKERCRYSGF